MLLKAHFQSYLYQGIVSSTLWESAWLGGGTGGGDKRLSTRHEGKRAAALCRWGSPGIFYLTNTPYTSYSILWMLGQRQRLSKKTNSDILLGLPLLDVSVLVVLLFIWHSWLMMPWSWLVCPDGLFILADLLSSAIYLRKGTFRSAFSEAGGEGNWQVKLPCCWKKTRHVYALWEAVL